MSNEGLIEVGSNLVLTLRSAGKLVQQVKGHNIFLNLGREWLPKLISYSALPPGAPPPPLPVTPAEDMRIRYMGLGIGGNRQLQLAVANATPLGAAPPGAAGHYPGTNIQTDTDPTVTRLERPVRLTSPIPAAPVPPPYDFADVWLGQVQAPAVYPTTTSVKFVRIFSELEISYGPFLTVPLSEIGLFLSSPGAIYVNLPFNTCVAYDTFDSVSKTNAFSLEVDWTIKFLWQPSTAS